MPHVRAIPATGFAQGGGINGIAKIGGVRWS
jgi:hypothetical protein